MRKSVIQLITILITIFSFSQATPGKYTIKNLSSNSKNSDFGPTFYGENSIIFSSARGSGMLQQKWDNNQPFLDLYIGTVNVDGSVSNIRNRSSNLNSRYHESSVSFTPDQKKVFFTRNNSLVEEDNIVEENNLDQDTPKKRRRRGEKTKNKLNELNGTTYLSIYSADLNENGEWINIKALPFNNRNYSVGHPTVNRDGTKLYFTSDMPGSYGLSDIFVVDILSGDNYSKPKNLGRKINTLGREMFPYIDSKNILYFSSDSRKDGVGGLDIYAIKIYDNSMSDAIHLGEPMNSERDDFGFILNNNIDQGYFSSNRKNGRGDDDIYHFIASPPLSIGCTQSVSGIVKNTKTSKPIAGALVAIFDKNGTQKASVKTSNIGAYTIQAPCDGRFKILASNREFKSDEADFSTENNPETNHAINLNLKPIIICNQQIKGIIKNSKTAEPIANAKVFLFDKNGKKQGSTKSTSKGLFKFNVNCGADFRIMSGKDGFESDEKTVTINNNPNDKVNVTLNLNEIIICKQSITGIVRDLKTSKPIANANIVLTNSNTNEQKTITSLVDGTFVFNTGCNTQFSLNGNKEGYEDDTTSVSINDDMSAKYNVALQLKLKPDLTEIKIVKNKVIVNIDPIYFELNKADITTNAAIELNKVVLILRKYPNLKIEGGSHTDARGTASNNLNLSTRRANSTVGYIIKQGIGRSRIIAKGYGETQPANHCVDGVRCSDDLHQQNRRTEFVILNPEVLGYID
jgi:outer membrane protein OmpA-like peptidoglycan-associated protein